jgi:hypothetical protein
MTWTHTAAVTITGSGTLTTAGKTFSSVTINGSGITVELGDALNIATRTLTVAQGSFTTNNFNVTAGSLSSSNSNTRTINLGSSTVTLSGSVNFSVPTGLTLSASAATISITSTSDISFAGGGQTFHNVSLASQSFSNISGTNTFNNLSFVGRTTPGLAQAIFANDITVNGTLTFTAGSNATMRRFVRSDVVGEVRTLTCNAAASLTDADFRDITIAGAAAPVGGTRLGDCKGNSGITFPAAKTVFYRNTGTNNWGDISWSLTLGAAATHNAFPLPQDTAVFPSATYPASGSTIAINGSYNIGTINMSARTSNTMTLTTSTNQPTIYGNWINGTGTTLSGTGTVVFAGRGSQTITSAGRTFPQPITVATPGGTVTLLDALTSGTSFTLAAGTFDTGGYACTRSSFSGSGTTPRSLSLGASLITLTVSGNAWTFTDATNLTVTGTGTISLTSSASAKTFTGGGIQTYPTLNQGGTGTLTVSGSNKFANITNTAIGRVQFTGGTTNEFDAFNLAGVSGNLLQLGSTDTTQATLRKPGAWNVGTNSTDAGNNTGLSFTGSSPDYLSVSYINGVATAAPTRSIFYGSTSITSMSFGGTAVTAAYYGSTKVF